MQSLLPRSLSSARTTSRALRCLNVNASKQSRSYAIEAKDASDPRLQSIDPSRLSITKTTTPKDLIPNEELVFGKYFTGTIHAMELSATTSLY